MSSVLPYQPFNPNASIMFQQPQSGFSLPNYGNVGGDPMASAVSNFMPGFGNGGDASIGAGDWLSSFKEWGGGFLGSTDKPGWGAPMLGAIGGLANTFLGMQMYGLQKDKLAEAKRQYNQDYQINKQLTNSRLEDRQRARVASNAGAYQSVGDYMNQYGVKG
jgi:hypothetical protein